MPSIGSKRVIPESAIETHILVWLRSKKVFAWKNVTGGFYDSKIKRFRKQVSPFAINGASDILGILPGGRFLAIECKSKYGKATPDQLMFIERINFHGGCAFVAKSLEDVQQALEEVL